MLRGVITTDYLVLGGGIVTDIAGNQYHYKSRDNPEECGKGDRVWFDGHCTKEGNTARNLRPREKEEHMHFSAKPHPRIRKNVIESSHFQRG